MLGFGPAWRLGLDALIVVWVVAWVALAGAIGADVRALAATGDAFVQLANGEDSLAATLDPLNHIPFVQLNLDRLTGQLHTASASARTGAAEQARAIDDLARLVSLATVALGLFPVLFVYLPNRAAGIVARRRRAEHRARQRELA